MPFDHKELLQPPVGRAAYSDRTSWLMSEMSRLAYLKFEGKDNVIGNVVDALADLTDKAKILDELRKYEIMLASSGDELETLKSELVQAQFELVTPFNSKDTQAFLAKRDSEKIAVLAFRGTEKNWKDIKTDLDARFYHSGKTKVHNGFLTAFEVVKPRIKAELAKVADYKLYITGHSLGGALALIATHELNSDAIAACYTFGSPKVGNSEFGEDIKPPIYRVVNAADMVTRVPPTWGIELVILLGKVIPVPWLRGALVRFLTRFRGYRHTGDMRYLTASKPDFSDLRLIPNLNIIDRSVRLIARLITHWKAGASDHGIANYCNKLKAHALKRLKVK